MIIEIHVTCKDEKEAKTLSDKLLKKKLVACANYFFVKSSYLWKQSIEHENETMLILKTNKKNSNNTIKIIKQLHSYDTPAITIHDIKSTKETKTWIDKETL